MSKRSRCVSLSLMAAAPFLLSACGESAQAPQDPVAAPGPTAYESVDACILDGRDAGTCQAAFEQAHQQALSQAPRFATGADCELEFQACQAAPAVIDAAAGQPQVQQAGGGSFMPILAGFLIGQAISNNSTTYSDRDRRSSAGSSYVPLYRSRQGSLAQVSPGSVGGKAYATTPVKARTVTKASATQAMAASAQRAASAKAASTRSASRGGFGGRSGGFGG